MLDIIILDILLDILLDVLLNKLLISNFQSDTRRECLRLINLLIARIKYCFLFCNFVDNIIENINSITMLLLSHNCKRKCISLFYDARHSFQNTGQCILGRLSARIRDAFSGQPHSHVNLDWHCVENMNEDHGILFSVKLRYTED